MSEEMDTEQVICPINPGHRRGGKRLTDLRVQLPSRPLEDFVWTWQSECLITDRVASILRQEGMTGFDLKPVHVELTDGVQLVEPTLWEVVVTGWAGLAPPESGVRLLDFCQYCGYRRYSCFTHPERLIAQGAWDGSDFFMVWPLPRFIFVSERVVTLIQREKLRGARPRPLSELECKDGLGGGPTLILDAGDSCS